MEINDENEVVIMVIVGKNFPCCVRKMVVKRKKAVLQLVLQTLSVRNVVDSSTCRGVRL